MSEETEATTIDIESEAIKALNIYQRINHVRAAVAYLKKEKQVSGAGGGYKVVTHDQVTAAVRPFLIQMEVVIVPHELESEVVLTGTATQNGTPWLRYQAKYKIDFVNIEDPKDFL